MSAGAQDIMIASIVAVADNGVIGRAGGMAWHLPSEFAYFRATTLGKPVIMGRKTFQSLGKPLAKRTNIVITRDPDWQAAGVTVCHSLEDAITAGKTAARAAGVREVFIIGGAEVYKQAMPLIDTLYLTEVHATPEGDTTFPAFDRAAFTEIFREDRPRQHTEDHAYSITILQRKDKS